MVAQEQSWDRGQAYRTDKEYYVQRTCPLGWNPATSPESPWELHNEFKKKYTWLDDNFLKIIYADFKEGWRQARFQAKD